MFKSATLLSLAVIALLCWTGQAIQEEPKSNVTTTSKKVFTYQGSMLPSEWAQLSLVNDRATIVFSNGSSQNAALNDLDLGQRTIIQKIQNSTSSPFTSAREKLSQWSSSVTSSVSKLAKSAKEQFDELVNSNNKKDEKYQVPANVSLFD